MLFSKILKIHGKYNNIVTSRVFYSRKSSSKNTGSYKVVTKAQEECNGLASHKFGPNANWELFGSEGFRFYMPGGIGPAWHDPLSAPLVAPEDGGPYQGIELECTVQDCPFLLRQAVVELFPGMDAGNCPLTVVTLLQKSSKSRNDNDLEVLTMQFVWAAQDICRKLKMAGYWADFINPFSGVPYLTPISTSQLYKNDERFRCLGFNIFQYNGCRVISYKSPFKFIGNLFTTAPASTGMLHDVIQDYD